MAKSLAWLPPVLLVGMSAASLAAPAPETNSATTIHPIPSGVADAEGRRGFVTNADGDVTALDLETGKPLWESRTAGRPLAVADRRVWVQVRDKDKANVIRVVGLGVDDGKPAVESDPIVLPDWVAAEEGRGAGRSFTSSAYLDGGDLFVRWQANTWYWGGAAPSPQTQKAARRHAGGVARVNLKSGKVEMLETDKAPPPPSSAAKVSAVDVETTAAGKQKVVLKRWDQTTEKPLEPMVLAEGGPFQVVTVPSAGAALVRDVTPTPGPPPKVYLWTVYSLTTGKETAHFTAEANAAEFTILGPRAFFTVTGPRKGPPFGAVLPRTLKAVDLKTGKQLWEMPLEGERLPPPPPP